jgi:FkbM family methyltransferase
MNLRHIAERFSRGVILRRHLPTQFRSLPLYVSPEAGLRYWGWGLETADPMLFRMVQELVRPGSVVWDVGANVGLFSLSAAALADQAGLLAMSQTWSHICCVPPNAFNKPSAGAAPVAVLCRRIRGQPQPPTQIAAAPATISYGRKGSSQAGGYRYQQATVTVSLDFLLDYFPAPSVLKIDVETAEGDVLRGASRLLRTVRPVIWCEVAADNSETVSELLHQGAYELSSAAVEPAKRTPLTRAPWDTLAVPKA